MPDDMYDRFCKNQFNVINTKLDTLNAKVFNGLSDVPHEVKWLKRLLIGLLVSIVAGTVGITLTNVRAQVHIDTLIEKVSEEIEGR